MGRLTIALSLSLLGRFAAYAEVPPEPALHFEVGLNTRHFAQTADQQTAFRGEMDPSTEAHSATTVDLRFTRWLPLNMFAGIEGEVGRLEYDGSNLAGAYGVFGAQFHPASAILAVEMAGGWRSVRYGGLSEDQGKFVAEPRVRAEFWLNPRVTVGAAVGSTLSAQHVWMAGVYIGVHSLVFGQGQP